MKIIKVGAVWCSSCLIMRSRLEEIEQEFSWLKIDYLDFDNDFERLKEYHLLNDKLPVLIIVDNQGKEIIRLIGEQSKEELKTTILSHKNK